MADVPQIDVPMIDHAAAAGWMSSSVVDRGALRAPSFSDIG